MECPNQTGKRRLDLWVKGSLSNSTTDSMITVIFCYSKKVKKKEVRVGPAGQRDAPVSVMEVIT